MARDWFEYVQNRKGGIVQTLILSYAFGAALITGGSSNFGFFGYSGPGFSAGLPGPVWGQFLPGPESGSKLPGLLAGQLGT